MPARWDRGRVLLACVQDRPLDEPVPELIRYAGQHRDLTELAELACRHGVTGWLWAAVRAGGLAGLPGAAAIRATHAGSVAAHLRTLSEVDLLDRVLPPAGVEYLVLKGPVLAENGYPRPDLRSYVDLDVLVGPGDFGIALTALEAAGCRLFERNWTLATDRLLGELRLFTPAGSILDLHWHVIADRDTRRAFPVDLAKVRARARTVRVGGRAVSTVDAADMVVHLALHASLAGGHRLLWLKDIEQALRSGNRPDWSELTERVGEWGAGPALALMLDRAGTALGLPVPAGLTRRLAADPGWRLVTRLADRLSRPGRGAGAGPSVGRIVARAARQDGRASRHELARRAVGAMTARSTRAADPRAPAHLFDPADRGSASYPAGGAAGRAAYLAAVAAQA